MKNFFAKALLISAPLTLANVAIGQLQEQSTASTSSIITAEFNQAATLDKKYIKKSHVYTAIQLSENVHNLQVSEDFGSYVIPKTNYLVIAPTDKRKYDRAQMVDKVTGEFLFSLDISADLNTIDMSGTKPGTYRLVLTNENGEKYVEDIMIM